ncbi:hypothetical protein IWW36_003656 [Coemansia brasiliensis]|uniref:NmrA-like domain-containing protein n=1 Tax=Coemansia brasiliensis TaxID=2650707 RepID=A0A9W8ICC6_9FUNG|nr:hypothetical protein IWW36_003656 [Coemansia brasiliensis]
MGTECAYNSIAVVGTGGYGRHFISALLATRKFVRVRAVTRKTSDDAKRKRLQALQEMGAEIFEYKSSSTESFKQAFNGIHTVISAVSIAAVPDQISMIDGAILANVQWFIPSEYGVAHYPSVWMPFTSPLAPKTVVQKYLSDYAKPKGLSYTIVYTGLALDYLDPKSLGLKLSTGSATLVGRGGSPVSFTAFPDVVSLVVNIVQRPAEMQNRFIRFAGSTTKMRELVKIVTNNDRGENVKIVCIEEAKSKFCELARRQDMSAFQIYSRLLIEEGLGQINRYREPLDNSLFPELHPEPIQQTLRRLIKANEATAKAKLKPNPAHRSATTKSVTDGLGRTQKQLDGED